MDTTTALAWAGTDACSLPTADRPQRVAAFDGLFVDALRGVERRGSTRARLLLDVAAEGRARGLADAESTCCSFFTFEVQHVSAGLVAMDVEVPAAHTAVLDGLVARAVAASGGTA